MFLEPETGPESTQESGNTFPAGMTSKLQDYHDDAPGVWRVQSF